MNNYLHRLAEDKFYKINKTFPVVLVCGPRQVGKTTMLKELSNNDNRTYVTLDDLDIRTLANNDPKLFFQKYKTPILIDEIQYAPNLFSYIKIMADEHQIPGEFWLTGSQSYKIMKNVTETLAGRIGIINMYSLTYNESIQNFHTISVKFDFGSLSNINNPPKIDINSAFNYIYNGGMPKVVSSNEISRSTYFSSYINSYLMRDVMEFGKISDTVRFNKFLSACASQVANTVNYANLALAADISQPTAKEWLEILQGMGIVYLIEPYFNNTLKRLTKTPKLYFYDTGLCSYLARIPSAESLSVSSFAGAYFENFVMNQFVIKYQLLEYAPNIYFYRDSDKNEIDIILEDFDGVTPLEIKLTANPNTHDLAKFKILDNLKIKVKPGGIICLIDSLFPSQNNNSLIPVSLI